MARDLEPYVRAWRTRFREADEARIALGREARSVLSPVVKHLVERWGATRIWLVGSLVDGRFREGSDIDLIVAGLPAGAALFRVAAEIDDFARPFRVDLVPWEDARPELREKAIREGELVHGGR